MKHLISLVSMTLLLSLLAKGQLKFLDGANYSQPVQIDSSENYIIGTNIDKTNRKLYNSGYYFSPGTFWTNVVIYNSGLNKTRRIFENNRFLIYPILHGYYTQSSGLGANYGAILRGGLLFCVKTDDYNKDGIIDGDDPIYLFICTKSGENLTQLMPSDMNVTSWALSSDGKKLFVKVQKDKNGDKKFTDEDEVIYQFDLNEDFSKIKSHQIIL